MGLQRENAVPRYFFDVFDGRQSREDEGTELAESLHAGREAVQLAGRIIGDEARDIVRGRDWYLEVRNERGSLAARLDFVVTAPAGAT